MLQLEVGKTYISKCGFKDKIVKEISDIKYPFRGDSGRWYKVNGKPIKGSQHPSLTHEFTVHDRLDEAKIDLTAAQKAVDEENAAVEVFVYLYGDGVMYMNHSAVPEITATFLGKTTIKISDLEN